MKTLQAVRTSASERELLLNELLRRNGARIYRTLAASIRPGTQLFNDLLHGDLQQAFLLGANAALDKAREEDDGRGKNDYTAYCSWSGMNAVKDRIRQAIRRTQRRLQEMPVGTFNDADLDERNEPAGGMLAFEYLVASNDNAATNAVDAQMIAAFFDKLSLQDRQIAQLLHLGYGPQQRNHVPGEHRGKRENYLRTLEAETGLSEGRLIASLKRLRIAAEAHFGTRR